MGSEWAYLLADLAVLLSTTLAAHPRLKHQGESE